MLSTFNIMIIIIIASRLMRTRLIIDIENLARWYNNDNNRNNRVRVHSFRKQHEFRIPFVTESNRLAFYNLIITH